jgi:hypothetical protein
MANNTAKIAELKAVLQRGVTTVTVNGTTTVYDLDVVRQQLRELEATDDTDATRKPRISSLNLGGLMQ